MTTAERETSPGPALAAPPGYSWRAWGIFWTVVIVLQVVLLSNNAAADTFLWRSTRWVMGDQDGYSWSKYKAEHAGDPQGAFYTRVDPPWLRMAENKEGQVVPQGRIYKRTEILWRVMRDLGEPVMTFILMFVVWVYDRRRLKAAVMLLGATIVPGVVGWLLRASAGRFRPINLDGANMWELWRGFATPRDLSWPSGHAALAFATAAALSYLSPTGRNMFIVIAVFCALSRVIMMAHFYSDVILGAAIGWTLGWGCMRVLDRILKDPVRVPTPRQTINA